MTTTTSVNRIYKSIAEQIITGNLQPGEKLEEKVDAAMLENPELRDYIDQLDVVVEPEPERELTVEDVMGDLPISRPDPAEVMRELEEILGMTRQENDPERPPESQN